MNEFERFKKGLKSCFLIVRHYCTNGLTLEYRPNEPGEGRGVMGAWRNRKIVVFLAKQDSFYIFMLTVMLLIHLLLSSGSVEFTS